MPVDLESDLTRLRRELLALGAKVDQRVYAITAAILDADVDAARAIKKGDEEIDRDDLAIEEECAHLLALAAPVATDRAVRSTDADGGHHLHARDRNGVHGARTAAACVLLGGPAFQAAVHESERPP